MFTMQYQQWICTVCGYNMIGEMPDICPFCGARHEKFVSWDEAEKTYTVTPYRVNPGFTMYIYGEVLFICDYAFPPGSKMQLNPFGPQKETRNHAARILEVISERSLETVCGYNFVTEFARWHEDFKRLLDRVK